MDIFSKKATEFVKKATTMAALHTDTLQILKILVRFEALELSYKEKKENKQSSFINIYQVLL